MPSHSVFESCKLKERIVFTACNFPKTNSKLKATGFQELKTVFLAFAPSQESSSVSNMQSYIFFKLLFNFLWGNNLYCCLCRNLPHPLGSRPDCRRTVGMRDKGKKRAVFFFNFCCCLSASRLAVVNISDNIQGNAAYIKARPRNMPNNLFSSTASKTSLFPRLKFSVSKLK